MKHMSAIKLNSFWEEIESEGTLNQVFITSPKVFEFFANFKAINYKIYKGWGRPRKSDYVLLKDWDKSMDKEANI